VFIIRPSGANREQATFIIHQAYAAGPRAYIYVRHTRVLRESVDKPPSSPQSLIWSWKPAFRHTEDSRVFLLEKLDFEPEENGQ